jgi:hypothetical protein
MKRQIVILAITWLIGLTMSACAGNGGATTEAETPAVPQPEAATAGPAATPTENLNVLPEDVPILEGAESLEVTLDGTYISYQAPSTVDDATKFYQDQLEAAGWERVNKKDSGFGDSITLLRSKPEQNIAVTLQSISGSQNIRVLIVLSPK